jgi:hypothetical protein
VFEVVGSADQRVSWTSWEDVGRVLASLAAMPAHAMEEYVRVSGDVRSVGECARIMDEARGDGERIEVREVAREKFKREVLEASKEESLMSYSRYLMGVGKLDFDKEENGGLGNSNEIVNPDDTKWKWNTVAEYAKETGGKPWC